MASPATAARKGNREAPLSAGDAGLDAWKNLLRGHAQLLIELDAELQEAHRLSLGDYDVLLHLASDEEGLRMCELAEAVVISPSGISRRVERLERAELVTRQRSRADARSVEAKLTAKGRRLFERARVTHLDGVQRHFVDRFSEAELATLRDLLAELPTDDVESCPSEASG